MRQRLDDLDARAAAALVGLQQRRPATSSAYARRARTSLNVIERGHIDPERAQQRGLSALAQLEREHVGAVQNPCAQKLQRSHVGERQRNRPRVTPEVRAGARLIEVEPGAQARPTLLNAARVTSKAQKGRRDARARQTAASAIRDAREGRSDPVRMSSWNPQGVLSCHRLR